jgi:hypothetical protein
MVYLYDACDKISDFCYQQLLRKISWMDGRTEGWKDGRTDRRTEGKQYTPHHNPKLRGAKHHNPKLSDILSENI